MVSEKITIGKKSDAGASQTAMLVQIASKFESKVHICKGENRYNAKSIMGMMSLGLVPGEEVEITVEGSDEQAALDEIKSYIK